MKREYAKICIIIGTKAELIKCIPVMLELQKRNKDYWFIHTGQHPLGKACEEFGVKKPDFILSPEPTISTKFWSKISRAAFIWNLEMILKIKRLLKKLKPKYVIYHGDTMSTSSAAIGSGRLLNPKKTWKNVHLEAGLRSGSIWEPFPEEISRQICDRFSDTLLAVSDLSEGHLREDKRTKNKEIIKIGNTIIDSAAITYNKAKKKYDKPEGEYALINLHRHENLRNKDRMKKIVEILKKIKINALWPLHDNTRYYLRKYGLMKEVEKLGKIKIMPLIDYSQFIFLLANCKYLIADGGSIQEESLVFKKPCVILRKRTERQEGLLTGINFLVGVNINFASRVIERIESGVIKIKNFKNPYGELGLSKNIIDILK